MKVIKLRRGPVEYIPQLSEGELGYTLDTNELYVGAANNNTTPNFNGGELSDTTKGRLIPRHGLIYEVLDIVPGELFYLEDEQSLAVGLQEKNKFLILNEPLNEQISNLALTKRDKVTLLTAQDIATGQITLEHLSESLKKSLGLVEEEEE